MIIEFAGPPGVGKSTIADYFINLLESSNLTVVQYQALESENCQYIKSWPGGSSQVIQSFNKMLYYFLAYLLSVKLSLFSARSLNMKKPMPSIIYWFSKDIILFNYFQKNNRKRIYFNCEGLFQHAVSLKVFGGPKGDSIYKLWLKNQDCSQIVVFVFESDLNNGFARFMSRGIPETWPGRYRTKEYIKNTYATFLQSVAEVSSEFENAGARVIRIDAAGSIAETQRRVLEAYQKYVTPAFEQEG